MSDPGQDNMEDVIKEEKERELINEIEDGAFETWIADNLRDLKEDFMKENFDEKSDEFKEYCEKRFEEQ